MTTLQTNRRTGRPTTGTLLAAAGVTIAVAVSALFLTLTPANHTQPTAATHTHTTSPYRPTIQTPAAGTAHLVVDPRTGQAHGTVTPPTARASQPSANADISNIGHRANP